MPWNASASLRAGPRDPRIGGLPQRDRGRRRAVFRTPLALAALAGIAAAVIAFAPADDQASATRLVILVLGIVAAWWALGRSAAVTASSPERFEVELRQAPSPPFVIAGLRSVETALQMSVASAFGLEFWLKPLLRELATWRLARNHGVDLAVAPEAARGILGDELWQLIRAAENRPAFRAPGPTLAQVRAALDRLERL
jgi:hypothetical protein